MKTLNGRHRPAALEALKQRAGERADIEFIDGYLPAAQKAALLERADCFVSLHRSEGFGLGLAESMARGTPVIATGYSGNMDFMSSANGWLVDWRETEVGPDCEVYPAHGHWAEPDLDHAAALMRTVYEDRAAAAAKASRAREDISGRYAPEVVGEIARARLELLLDTARPGRAVERNALETARRRLGSAARRVRAKLTGPA
jgi:glycosyltransferase involved in cell wall biosynthesis